MGKKIELNQQFSFNVALGADTIKEDTKTVSFILSDETIISRGWFDMKLLHGANNVNLERSSILKVFFNHDSRNLPIGKWSNLRLEDKKLKGDAIFDSNDEFAMKIFNKIKDGFLESISVGVSLEKYDVKQRDKQKDLLIVKKWSIFEASVVNIPAIPNAKVGLDLQSKDEINNKENNKMTVQELQEKHPELYQEVFRLGVSAESQRLKAIDKIIKPELAKYFQDLKYDGKSTAEQIELAQYRKMEELSKQERLKIEQTAKKIEIDGLSLGRQVLDMGLGSAGEDAVKAEKEKLELEEDAKAFFGGEV